MLTRRFSYIVEDGDTLFSIALKFNVPLDFLKEINNIENPDLIYPEQIIEIPVTEEFYQIAELVKRQCGKNASPVTAEAEITPEINTGNITYKRHRVRRGDTVYLLAKEYNTTTGNILALNPQITDVRNIKIGSIITIPIPPENSTVYVVRPGDTLYKIAQTKGVTVEDIMMYNYIDSDYTIYPGQQLVIPKV